MLRKLLIFELFSDSDRKALTDTASELVIYTSHIALGLCMVFFAYRIFMVNRDASLGEDVERGIADTIIKTLSAVLLIAFYDEFIVKLSTLFNLFNKSFGWKGIIKEYLNTISQLYNTPIQDTSLWGLIRGGLTNAVAAFVVVIVYPVVNALPMIAVAIMRAVYDLYTNYLLIIGPLAMSSIILPNASKTVAAGWFRSFLAVSTMPFLWFIFFKFSNLFIGNSVKDAVDFLNIVAGMTFPYFTVMLFLFKLFVISLVLTLSILFSYKAANSAYTGVFAASGANVGPGILSVATMGLLKKG